MSTTPNGITKNLPTAEPVAICAHCGRGMNPGDELCCPQSISEEGDR